MITNFVNSAIVIDDQQTEADPLLSELKSHDIQCVFYTPSDMNSNQVVFQKNRQLIFLDLSLDDSKKTVENIALIRKLLKKSLDTNFGIYGIIMWSKHQHHIDSLKEKLQEDRNNKSYPTPIFVIGLDKTKYIQQGNYNNLLSDIENALKADSAATFFLEWSNSVQQAKDSSISKIYSLMHDYKTQSDDITYILTQLALNHTGIHKSMVENYPLHIDAFKAFDEILNGELINSHASKSTAVVDTNKSFSSQTDLPNIYAQLNSAILIDTNNLNQSIVIPGNVYEMQTSGSFKSDKAPAKAKNIVIEITPPCDFSNSGKRVRARLIGGFVMDISQEIQGKIQEDLNKQKNKSSDKQKNIGELIKKYTIDELKCNKECFYSEVYPIIVPNEANPQLMILDFRYFGHEDDANLKNGTKYKLWFRTKPKLFADVIQKFSSHAARLGLSVIHS
ncbi:MAG: hypothetical protein LBM07_06255 [Culturomica sp.]|jgi:hypothetical protein|nr:hypothetical protein [Culturomica sp.]